MENTYLFRAKRFGNDEWLYGLPSCNEDGEIEEIEVWDKDDINYYSVDSATFCQYIGYKDKNGKLIFEHDIVNVKYIDGQENYQEIVEVTYSKHGFTPYSWEYECEGCNSRCEILEIEVIGNVFDNQNLLKESRCE